MFFIFKNATVEDFDTFNKLFNEAITLVQNDGKITTREPLTREEFNDWIKDLTIVLMFMKEDCVGYAISFQEDDHGNEQIFEIFITKDFRKRGFGRELMGHIEDESRKKGKKIIWLKSDNMDTDIFFRHLSYRYNSKSEEYYKLIASGTNY